LKHAAPAGIPLQHWLYGLLRHYHYPSGFWFAVGVCIALSLVLGVTLSKLIELPLLSLRDRFFPSRGSSALANEVCMSSALDGQGRVASHSF
jgi:peptidoglycan/LPS O-acetylase OafA/YrhL